MHLTFEGGKKTRIRIDGVYENKVSFEDFNGVILEGRQYIDLTLFFDYL